MAQTKTTEQQLRELLDKEEIRELVARYCHHVCAGDADAIANQYSNDAAFELPEGLQEGLSGEHTGRAAIRASMASGVELYKPWPFVHNHVIEILSENEARGWLHSEIRMGKRNLETGMIVSYTDDYVRENGEWKFRYRKIESTILG